ncbi:MAG: O-antigen ligase family protein [bacterium]|nr:O-antigen ligase family protein [bacterium]
MDLSKIIFIALSLVFFAVVPAFLRDVRRYYLGMASFMYVFTSGWVFYHYTGLMLADLPILALLAVSVFSGRRIRFSQPPVGGFLLAIIALGLASAAWSKQPGWAIAEISKYMRGYLLMVVLVHNIRDVRDLRLVVNGTLAGLLIESLLGIYQWKFGALGVWFLGERPAWRVDWRTFGTFFVPAFYANYVAMALSLSLRMFLYYRPSKVGTAVYYGAVSVFGLIALYTTYARGPWIGAVTGILLVSLLSMTRARFRPRANWTFAVFGIFLAVFLLRYNQHIVDQFGAGRKKAYESRFSQANVAYRIIAKNPLHGVGLGNYQEVSWDYLTPEEKSLDSAYVVAWMVHNSYLLLASELGIPGGILFVCWFLSILSLAWRVLNHRMQHPFVTQVSMGILGGILSLMVFLIPGPDIHEYSLMYQICLYSGMLLAAKNILDRAERTRALRARSGPDGTSPVRDPSQS